MLEWHSFNLDNPLFRKASFARISFRISCQADYRPTNASKEYRTLADYRGLGHEIWQPAGDSPTRFEAQKRLAANALRGTPR